jgi:hypothetical protein
VAVRLIAGAASLLIVGLCGLAIRYALPHQTITAQPSSGLARSLNADDARVPAGAESWVVTTATSARNMLVVEVQAVRLEEAMDIAKAIVEPVLPKNYEEILIYVHPPGGFSDGPMRRVQWTPQNGYVETVFAPVVPSPER